ncbi:MAG: hypothetical protein J7M13_03105 [Synergistetes bacterium]|nr:hypothetical protein [Synergistota bacterium]
MRFRSLNNICAFIDKLSPDLKLGLVSPVATDYPYFDHLVDFLLKENRRVSFGSFRVEGINEKLLDLLNMSGQRTITLAPETADEELRRSIGKDFSNDLLEEKISMIYKHGFRRLKLYFMIGLPEESPANAEKIGLMIRSLRDRFRGLEVIATVTPFVPKPFTPFEREDFLSLSEISKRLRIIKKASGIGIRSDGVKNAWLEALISRGDEKIGLGICCLGKKVFSIKAWESILDLGIYMRYREETPWRITIEN